MTNKDEIAELKKELAEQKAKVEALERANKPKEPFVREPWQPIDYTAGMSMPRSVMEEMARAVPDHVMSGVVRDSHAPRSPTMHGPADQVTASSPRGGSAGDGTGWARSIPLGPPPGLRYVDAQIDAQDRKDRRELIEQKAREQALLKAADSKR
jgi:hypothetical protein